jgi:hypothetical protein
MREALSGLRGAASRHRSRRIGFQANGHPGFPKPHYDMHFYLVTDAEDSAITCKMGRAAEV